MDLRLTKIPIAQAEMLIRKPVMKCMMPWLILPYPQSFGSPKDWRRLEVGKHIRWEWEMVGVLHLG